jgi:hypothetical protein
MTLDDQAPTVDSIRDELLAGIAWCRIHMSASLINAKRDEWRDFRERLMGMAIFGTNAGLLTKEQFGAEMDFCQGQEKETATQIEVVNGR